MSQLTGQLTGQLKQALEKAVKDAIANVLAGKNLRDVEWGSLQDTAKAKVHEAIARALAGQDHPTIVTAIMDALQDGKISSDEWRGAVLAWANQQAGSNALAQDVLNALQNGKLSKTALLQIGLNWGKTHADSDTAKALLEGITNVGFNEAAAWDSLKVFLQHSKFDQAVAGQIIEAVETDHAIDKREIFQLLALWASSAGRENIGELISRLAEGSDPVGFARQNAEKLVLGWLNGQVPDVAKVVFEKIQKQDWLSLAGLFASALQLDPATRLLSQLTDVNGDVLKLAQAKLEDFLSHAQIGHSTDLAQAIIDLATGARSLFAEGAEPEAGDELRHPAKLARWHEVREVIYLSQLAINGGSVVSTDPQGKLHVFQAAKIRFNTPLNELLDATATKSTRQEFCNTLTAFLDAHFAGRIRRFGDDNVLVLAESELVVDHGQIARCNVVFDKITDRLR